MTAVYRLNGGENVALNLDNAGAPWNSMNSSEFVVRLEEGFNEFKLSGTIINQDNWANIDCIDIISAEAIEEPDGYPETVSGFVRVKKDNISFDEGKVTANVDAAYEGEYRFYVGYMKDGEEPQFRKVFGTTHLNEGSNVISVDSEAAEEESAVYFDLAKTPVTIVEETGAERYEAEDHSVRSANNPPAEHQGFYSGRAQDNGVGGMGATVSSFNVGDDIIAKKLNYTDYSIFAKEDGAYKITIAGNGAGTNLTAVYQLEGGESVSFVLSNDGQGWDHMVYADITVELTKGYNRFILGGTWNGDWLNYDYIDVVAVDDGQVEEPTEPEDPEDPDTPENPDDPGTGEVVEPENPDDPGTPDVPETPEEPEKPGNEHPPVAPLPVVVKTVVRAVVKTVVKVVSWILKLFR